jgi:hypothetical protein
VAFDRSRPVAWKQLLKWAALVTILLNVTFALFARSNYGPETVLSSLLGAGFYVLLGALMTKFGWQPGRVERPARRPAATATADGRSAGERARPAPTKRTNATNRRTPPRRR